jgi:hypothetical protein
VITVEFVGPVRRPGPERRLELADVGSPQVDVLLARLGYSSLEAGRLTVLVDGRREALSATVPDGARVEILLPVGGG